MTAISLATADWLALRAPADAAARSRELVAELARLLDPRDGELVVHDLGSGTGAMMRWLAPQLTGPQNWVLHDGDPGILAHIDPEPVRDRDGSTVAVRTSIETLAELTPRHLAGAGLVTASALLDVVTADEAARVVDAITATGAPALFSLSVTGRAALDPVEPIDVELAAAFDDHQRRTTVGRRRLGPDAPGAIGELFARAGWHVRVEATPWMLGPDDTELIGAWLDGWVGAAVEQRPELREAAGAAAGRRRVQLAAGALRVAVGHEDLLAWPG